MPNKKKKKIKFISKSNYYVLEKRNKRQFESRA